MMSAIECTLEVFVAIGALYLAMSVILGRQGKIKRIWLENACYTHTMP